MRSLLHQTTLTIIAVLVLISCATQTQAIGVSIDENSDPNLYARNHIDAVATRKGLSNVQWLGGKSGASSFARLMYGGEPAFMTCMAGDRDRAAFEALVNARTTLKGANEEYRNYVKYPLTSVQVPALQSQPAGNCFIYRYIGGPALWPFIFSKGTT
ncbi:hypothetical protein BDF22DRAFT_695482 [Syncephalis plumigaleata]|nr:hypothetical protein BDF22DRAFT_695482 [Syncephalis plumigaleata]